MANPTATLEDVAQRLAVGQDELKTAYQVVGQAPAELASHATLKDFIINGVTPEDFIKTHSAEGMSFDELKVSFKKICADYGSNLKKDTKSKALEFCSKIIYEIGPQSRSVKKADGDKMWKFKFFYKYIKKSKGKESLSLDKESTSKDKEPTGKEIYRLSCKVCYVCIYKTDNSSFKQSSNPSSHLIMSVRMASLLCIETFCKLIEYCALTSVNKVFFTPLAGAIYSSKDVESMSIELNIRTDTLIKIINSSCQSGGHLLEHSTADCAFAAAIAATKGLTNEKSRTQIIGKIVKQYITAGKEPDDKLFAIYLKYACGGVPAKYNPMKLIEEYDRVHVAMRHYKPIPLFSSVNAPGSLSPSPRSYSPGPSAE